MDTMHVWFVTGASKGLGLTLVKTLLAEGYKVAATSRNRAALTDEIGEASDYFLPLAVELTDEQSVKQAIEQTVSHFGTLDVVVNNAGYGQMGALEELSDEEARKSFDVNVFGLLNVVRQAMPVFRKNQSGHFFNITSIGGFAGNFAGWGIYCATKFAVSGLTEGLAAESRSFGVKTTLVYPGYFRTNFLASGSVQTPAMPISDYSEARESESFHRDQMNGNQQGSPEKFAEALIQLSKHAQPPLHLFLGPDAYEMAHSKMTAVQTELEQWKSVTLSTSFE